MSLDVGEALYYVAGSKVLRYCLVLLKRYLFFLNTFSLRIFYPNVFLPMSNIQITFQSGRGTCKNDRVT